MFLNFFFTVQLNSIDDNNIVVRRSRQEILNRLQNIIINKGRFACINLKTVVEQIPANKNQH